VQVDVISYRTQSPELDVVVSSEVARLGSPLLEIAQTQGADTVPGNASTTFTLSSVTFGWINSANDTDWYRLQVEAGRTYTIALSSYTMSGNAAGTSLPDPYLRIYDSSGLLIGENDDSLTSLDSRYSYTATSSGYIYVSAGSADGRPGSYSLLAVSAATPTDNIPDTTSTTSVLTVGGSVSSQIDFASDTDWHRITLNGGQGYVFALNAATSGGLGDPFIEIRDASGKIVASNDDGPNGLNSEVRFTPTTAGVYYVTARAFSDETGRYTLTAQQIGPQDPVDTIDWGTKLNTSEVRIYFAGAGQTFGGYSADRAWTNEEIRSVMNVTSAISAVANVRFTVVTDRSQATMVMVLDSGLDDGVAGMMTTPPSSPAIGVFSSTLASWNAESLNIGGIAYSTILHEIGHGLGLAHPHDAGGSSEVMEGVLSEFGSYGSAGLNQGVYTIMSYNDGWPSGPAGKFVSYGYGGQAGPMALDIAALQDKYGAVAANTGNTVYSLPILDITASAYYRAIWDTGGVDTISASSALDAAVIDLRPATLLNAPGGGGFVSYVGKVNGGLTIAAGVWIENAIGGFGADILIGNELNNVLKGNAQGDTYTGGLGSDTFVLQTGSKDFITDFVVNVDKIGLDRGDFGTLTGTTLADSGITFQLGSAATGAGRTLFYDTSNRTLYWDADGSGAGAAVAIAQLGRASMTTVSSPATLSIGSIRPISYGSEWSTAGSADLNGDGLQDVIWRNGKSLYEAWTIDGFQAFDSMAPADMTGRAIAGLGDFNGDGKDDILFRDTATGAMEIRTLNGSTLTSLASPGVRSTEWAVAAVADFNEDGHADILWRNTATGQLAGWMMRNGGFTGDFAPGDNKGLDWNVVGSGDFNGDGDADILWRNAATGQVEAWLMSGGVKTGSFVPGAYSTAWNVAGIADFNNDGVSDVLWRNPTTGQVDGWLLKNGAWAGSFSPGFYDTTWQVAGLGDYDGDGNADVLWRNAATGQTDAWRLRSGNWTGSYDPARALSDWKPALSGDFNGDGSIDVLWDYKFSNAYTGWLMSDGRNAGAFNLTVSGASSVVAVGDFNSDGVDDVVWRTDAGGYLASFIKDGVPNQGSMTIIAPGSEWTLFGAADFNADGGDDFLWRNSQTGVTQAVLMKNGVQTGAYTLGSYNLEWGVQGIGDLNGDGTADIFWRNPQTGQVDLWLLKNGAWAGSYSPGFYNTDWQFAGIGDFNGDGTDDILWRQQFTGQMDIWTIRDGNWAGSFDPGSMAAGWTVAAVGDFNHDGVDDVMWLNTATGEVKEWIINPPNSPPSAGDFIIV